MTKVVYCQKVQLFGKSFFSKYSLKGCDFMLIENFAIKAKNKLEIVSFWLRGFLYCGWASVLLICMFIILLVEKLPGKR